MPPATKTNNLCLFSGPRPPPPATRAPGLVQTGLFLSDVTAGAGELDVAVVGLA
jgi:hypothetical protein